MPPQRQEGKLVRIALRLALAGALLGAAMVGNVAPAFAVDTVTVTCSNGFQRTVAAKAARGVATSLNKFNQYNKKNITCVAGAGALRISATSFRTVSCTNGFERRVNARAAGGITKALNAFNTRSRTGVTCALNS
jgi:hypothetical protein